MGLAAHSLTAAPVDDALLIDRVKAGDEAAFSQLYKRHARHVAGVVYRLLGNDHQLEDIVQDTFVIGLGQLDNLREPGALGRWLRTIAVRRVHRHLASKYRQRAIDSELQITMPKASEPELSQEVHALYRALAKLPDKLRLPWMLHHIEGETLPVVAEMCETSLTSVKRHIAQANERLERIRHAG
jgi:RNA polymerase sigma-70 factor (ECF subfamily)